VIGGVRVRLDRGSLGSAARTAANWRDAIPHHGGGVLSRACYLSGLPEADQLLRPDDQVVDPEALGEGIRGGVRDAVPRSDLTQHVKLAEGLLAPSRQTDLYVILMNALTACHPSTNPRPRSHPALEIWGSGSSCPGGLIDATYPPGHKSATALAAEISR
jgi:hypothetical protein